MFYYSNSYLSKLKAELNNEPIVDYGFSIGIEFKDELLFGVDSENSLVHSMVEETIKNTVFNSLFTHPSIKLQHEYFGEFEGLPFMAKADMLIPNMCMSYIKTTSCKNLKVFTDAIFELDYDRQMYLSMELFQCDSAVLIATTKEKKPKVFVVPISKNDYIYNSGKSKTLHLISIIKSL